MDQWEKNKKTIIMAKGRRWTKEEDDYVSKNYGKQKSSEIARSINRTVDAVNWRAKHIGAAKARSRKWSPEEIDVLFRDIPLKEMAEITGRTVSSVRKKKTIVKAKKGIISARKEKLKELFDLSIIEDGVPNVDRFSISSQHFALLSSLKVNQSYEFPASEYSLVRNQIQLLPNKNFETKKWSEDTRRVWRIK